MIRLHMVVEGQSEEEFVNSLLVDHLGASNISTDVRRVETSRRRARFRRSGTVEAKIFRGGLLDYEKAKGDMLRWMKEDKTQTHILQRCSIYTPCQRTSLALPTLKDLIRIDE